jgi:hypothetical protein
MSISGVGPAPLGARQFVTLSSGTSWTVPAGVNFVNATLIGGGGGGGYSGSAQYSQGYYGSGGQMITSTVVTIPGASIAYTIGGGGAGGSSGLGTNGTSTTFTGATTALGGIGGGTYQNNPSNQNAGLLATNGGMASQGSGYPGGNGGAGQIILEFWI